MKFQNRLVEFFQKLQSFLSDPHRDDAPVQPFAGARHKPAGLKAVEEARNVRVAGQHPVGDFATGQALKPGPAEDPEGVILRVRKGRRFEGFVDASEKSVGGPLEAKVGFLPGGPGRCGFRTLVS